MSDIITIRMATIKDSDEIIRLAEQWLNPLYNKDWKEFSLKLTLFELDEYRFNHIIYIVEEKNKLIGFCDFMVWVDWLTFKRRLIITHVYVDEKHRQEGIGTALLNKILKDFRPDFTLIDTKPEKFPYAEDLYKKLGFKENPKRKWLERIQ